MIIWIKSSLLSIMRFIQRYGRKSWTAQLSRDRSTYPWLSWGNSATVDQPIELQNEHTNGLSGIVSALREQTVSKASSSTVLGTPLFYLTVLGTQLRFCDTERLMMAKYSFQNRSYWVSRRRFRAEYSRLFLRLALVLFLDPTHSFLHQFLVKLVLIIGECHPQTFPSSSIASTW